LAAEAPSEPGRWHRWKEKVGSWHGEIRLGTAEAVEGLASTAGHVSLFLANPLARVRSGSDLRNQASTVVDVVQHPVDLAKAVVDWDTWRTNPARAFGHLTPDLLLALGTGGTAAGVRAAEIASRRQVALGAAMRRDAVTRAASGAQAEVARRRLVEAARSGQANVRPGAAHGAQRGLTDDVRPRSGEAGLGGVTDDVRPRSGETALGGVTDDVRPAAGQSAHGRGGAAWTGEGGTWLTASQNASAEAFHRLSTARANAVTRAVEEAAAAAGGLLRGLDTRVKSLESFKRKTATVLTDTGMPLSRVLSGIDDTVRYTMELPDRDYVQGVSEAARRLQDLGYHPKSPHNAWHSGRYRGINSSWVDPASGVSFEVQFHTPASWAATVRTHGLYEVFRRRTTPPARKAEVGQAIAREYETAPRPGWVQALRGNEFPPPVPAPIILPPSCTVPAGLAGAGTAHALISARRESEARSQRRLLWRIGAQ
jgi:hypothetical protein